MSQSNNIIMSQSIIYYDSKYNIIMSQSIILL